jgi:peptidoglycan hydrolase CwlO-like protein
MGRRLFGDGAESTPDGTANPVQQSHHDPNPQEPMPEEQAMAASDPRDNPVVQTDPTQSLFSSLGRFCRHFTRAQSIPNSPWPAECMQELTASLKVCLDQNWTSLQRALIDTARVLSSYDRAGRAIEALPFLQKSHDILSLMVGDLILDRVTDLGRYGWTDHFARAVVTLNNRGIALVEDDSADASAVVEESVPAVEPAVAPAVFESAPPFDELPPTAPAGAGVDVPEMPLPEEPELSVEPEPAEPEAEEDIHEPESELEPELKPEPEQEAPPPPEETFEPEAAVEPEPEQPAAPAPAQVIEETVEALNTAMQQAIMTGDVAQAKTLAIRLAAALARREIDTAQDNLAAARDRLDLNDAAIGEGQQRVSDAEARVQHAETEISAREAESQACRERISTLDEEIHARKAEVADLDAQIQSLQERRAQEAALLHERESERAASVAGESLIQTEIESLNEEEEAAREFLESARAKLDTMRAERIRIEGEIADICGDVERRKRAVRAIERPLSGEDDGDVEPVQESKTEQSGEARNEELLF